MHQMGTKLFTSEGLVITDVLRFFHGDGPAQQLETGHSIGGNYCSFGCGAQSTLFDDLVYCYRSPTGICIERSILGKKKMSTAPFDRLSIAVTSRTLLEGALISNTKKQPQLDKGFEELKMGIVSVPASLQTRSSESLESLHLAHYEVSPVELLHDIKGHFSNVIKESIPPPPPAAVFKQRQLRGCDYIQAMIWMYLIIRGIQPDSTLCKVFQTAVKILYASESKRSTKNVLNLHNIAFHHAYLCAKLFVAPK